MPGCEINNSVSPSFLPVFIEKCAVRMMPGYDNFRPCKILGQYGDNVCLLEMTVDNVDIKFPAELRENVNPCEIVLEKSFSFNGF
jgi:hypothetical protein